MNNVFNKFEKLLKKRLEKRIGNSLILTTEDSIRYTFFAALIEENISPDSVILEIDHPFIPRAKIDTWVENIGGHPAIFEFKYDRNKIADERNKPRTMQAGSLFNDIGRLVRWTEGSMKRFFIYVTDNEMKKYLSNPENGLHNFFLLKLNSVLTINNDFISSKSPTFQKHAGEIPECQISCRYSESLPDNHELKIYEVLSIQD